MAFVLGKERTTQNTSRNEPIFEQDFANRKCTNEPDIVDKTNNRHPRKPKKGDPMAKTHGFKLANPRTKQTGVQTWD